MSAHLTDQAFKTLPLNPALQAGLDQAGFEFCTPIQAQSLPLLLQGKDVAGQAQTGTGKTIAFLLATFQRLLETAPPENWDGKQPRALIL
ncbi:MAG: DEAD/DEAH box helicase, partial [Methylophaga sp.]|nr:DEAD/DEAH box helicase [Methylophaga sp.]